MAWASPSPARRARRGNVSSPAFHSGSSAACRRERLYRLASARSACAAAVPCWPVGRRHATELWLSPAGAAGWPALPAALPAAVPATGWLRSASRRSAGALPPAPERRGRWRAGAAMPRGQQAASARSESVLRQPRHLPEQLRETRRQQVARHRLRGWAPGERTAHAPDRSHGRITRSLVAVPRRKGLRRSGATGVVEIAVAGGLQGPCGQDSEPAGGRQFVRRLVRGRCGGNRQLPRCPTGDIHSLGAAAAWAQVPTPCRIAGNCRAGGTGGLSEFLTTQLPENSVIFLTFCCKTMFFFWHECCSVTNRFC